VFYFLLYAIGQSYAILKTKLEEINYEDRNAFNGSHVDVVSRKLFTEWSFYWARDASTAEAAGTGTLSRCRLSLYG
jgi:hypothetical protein